MTVNPRVFTADLQGNPPGELLGLLDARTAAAIAAAVSGITAPSAGSIGADPAGAAAAAQAAAIAAAAADATSKIPTAATLSGATTVGRNLLIAPDAGSARTAIGAEIAGAGSTAAAAAVAAAATDASTKATAAQTAAATDAANKVAAEATARYVADAAAFNPNDIGYTIGVVVGQSNAEGFATDYDTARIDIVDSRIMQYGTGGTYASVVTQASEPLASRSVGQTGYGMGPALSFSRWLLHRMPFNRRILIVPAAVGGSTFEGASGFPFVAENSWRGSRTDVTTNLFERAVTATQAALAAAGPNARLGWMLWVHGETDATNGTSSSTYQTDLDELIDNFRTRLGAPTLPFLIGQMVPDYLSASGRAAINAVHIDTPRRKVNTAFFYGPTGMGRGDGNHYNAAGQRVMGRQALDAYARALANVAGVAPLVPTGLTLSQSGTTVAAMWAQPVGRVTDFNVRYSVNAGTSWTGLARAQSIDINATITGLTLGQTLLVQVATVNEQGTSAWSASTSLTLAQIPNTVGTITPATASASQQPLTWAAPTVDGTHSAATAYLVEYKLHSSGSWLPSVTVAGTSATVTGLTNTSSYDYRVTAQNPGGSASASATLTASTAAPVPPIDTVGVTAFRAYGLRKLRSAYSGNAILVRRSSDSTTQAIGFIANGDLDTASLLTFCGAGSGYIATWYDQSGNGYDIAQATTTAQPTIVNAGALVTVNSLPAANFAAAAYLQDTNSAHLGLYSAGAASVLAVTKVSTATANMTAIAEAQNSASTYGRYALLSLSSTSTQGASSADDANGAIVTAIGATMGTNLAQVSNVDSGTLITGWLNGTQNLLSSTYSRSGHTVTESAFIVGGTYFHSATITGLWNGYISEVVLYNSALTAGQRQAGEASQKLYFSTP